MKSVNQKFISLLFVVTIFAFGTQSVFAQENSPSVLYVPLIGLTSVPSPLALPNGEGNVTYNYAVKNFLSEIALTNISVVDNSCGDIKFLNGDDNNDNKLDHSETWRYACTTKLSQSTQSIAIATGHAGHMTATHKAYATVVVGLKDPPPLVSIVNITKVAYPLSLPKEGGEITFTYKVNNPGEVPLRNVSVTDDKCSAISSRLGDTNGNNILDMHEVWIYTCNTRLTQTTTNTVRVEAYGNGLKAIDDASITVSVASPLVESSPNFPEAGIGPDFNNKIWKMLSVLLGLLVVVFFLTRKSKLRNSRGKRK